MGIPPRDRNGKVIPHDDPDIDGDHGLFRYIHPVYHVTWDGNRNAWRISSAAFSESDTGGMSVDWEQSMLAAGLLRDAHLPGADHGIARLRVSRMREIRLQVGPDPLPHNPHHAEVWGIKKQSQRRQIRDSVEMVREFQKRSPES